MNKTLDKHLQMYISKMAIESMPFGGSVWGSSAKDLEEELRKRKIKIPYQLYYEYKLPNEYKPEDFMRHLVKEYFVNNFYSYFAGKILKDKELKISDKSKIFKYIWNSCGKYKNQIKQYESLIREQNPELTDVSVIKVYDPRSLVYGALFGFAPQEIKYYADGAHRDFAKEKEIFKAFKSYGIDVSYVLAPETAEIILAALKQNTQNKSKER